MAKQAEYFYEFGPFRVDPVQRLLWRDGQLVPLMPKVFDTLLLLVENNGQVLEKGELMQELWPDSFVEEGSLSHNVSVLRKLLGAGSGQYIETLPRRGYRFTSDVRQVPNAELNLIVRRRTRAHIRATEEYETEDQTHALLGNGPAIKSLAVLPFIMIGVQNSEDYLGLGLADALITRLSSARQIIVRPTSAVRAYTDSQRDAISAGRELRVSTVLEGTVQRAGERLRVMLNLIDVVDGLSLWADKIQTTFTDIFEVQDSIAEQVAQSLAVKLNTTQEMAQASRPTKSSEAYKLYLKGRFFLGKSGPEGVRSAIEAFQQAVTTDPEFAEAYAGLAESYIIASYLYLPHKQALPAAREAAEKALELNGMLAEAHNSLAAARWMYDWNREGAEKGFLRALALNPNLAIAHRWFGLFLAWGGRFDEGIAELNQAIDLDPLSLFHNAYLGLALYLSRRYDAAIEQCFKTLELDPNNLPSIGFIGLSYIEQGKIEDAISLFERQRQVVDAPLLLSELGYAYARAGKAQEALKLLAELKARPATPPEYLAVVYAGLDDKDQAFAWLNRAYEERTVMLPVIYADPKYDSLRSDPRFTDLLRRLGLPI